ncbi:Uncharacterised protein [Collinsella intestinalis]|nr:Uncharacterised protein [Collinsella intestinalis]
MMPPKPASRLCDWSATTLSWPSKVCRNHTTMLAAKMIVNARWRKSLALSQASMTVVFALGRR